MRLTGVAAFLAALCGALASRPARACSAANPDAFTPTAVPRDGSSDVPTATSFVILSYREPVDVVLQADGVAVPLSAPTRIGGGADEATSQPTVFWQVKPSSGFLPASAELVLSMADPKGGRLVLTTVHTAAGYDKQPGAPGTLNGLTLTRVRYPLAEIGSGDCVFAEYIGFITIDATAASIPGTPPASVLSTISLSPKNGGAAVQSWTFTGNKPFTGDPPGGITSHPSSQWFPYLDPTLEYCAGITSFGFGDLGRLPVTSNVVCARVNEVSMPGAGDTTDAGDARMTDAGADAGPQVVTAHDAGVMDVGSDHKIVVGDGPPTCAIGAGSAKPSPIVVVLLAAALRRRRRRQEDGEAR